MNFLLSDLQCPYRCLNFQTWKWRMMIWTCLFSFVVFKTIETILLGLINYWTGIIPFITYTFYPFYDVESLNVWFVCYSHIFGCLFFVFSWLCPVCLFLPFLFSGPESFWSLFLILLWILTLLNISDNLVCAFHKLFVLFLLFTFCQLNHILQLSFLFNPCLTMTHSIFYY